MARATAPGSCRWSIAGGCSSHLVYPLCDLEPEHWEPRQASSAKEVQRGS
jgi:hypothetical protein